MEVAKKIEIPATGILDGLPIEEYHAHPSISNSGLGHLMRSPAHYIAYRNEPHRPTAAQELGVAVHFAILEPKLFFSRYVKRPEAPALKTTEGKPAEKPWATKEGKAILAELSRGGTRTVLPADEFEQIERILEEVHSHPTASALLSKGKTEQSIFWTDAETGIQCRARPDYLRNDGVFVDVKTTQDASYKAFQRSMGQYGYHRQAAFGMDGLRAATGRGDIGWALIAIECEAPVGIAVYVLDDTAIGIGRNEYRGALTRLADCIKTDTWPCYPTETQALELPRWML